MRLEVGHHQASAGFPAETHGEVGLWMEVMRIAFEDAQGNVPSMSCFVRTQVQELIAEDARRWIASDDNKIGSFRWICGLLDLNADAVRERLAERQRRGNGGARAHG